MDKPRAALSSYNKTIELNPKYAEGYFNRAGLYILLGDSKKAKSDLEQSIKLEPSYRDMALADESLRELIS